VDLLDEPGGHSLVNERAGIRQDPPPHDKTSSTAPVEEVLSQTL
jgi:hypothetical protein